MQDNNNGITALNALTKFTVAQMNNFDVCFKKVGLEDHITITGFGLLTDELEVIADNVEKGAAKWRKWLHRMEEPEGEPDAG